jgi:hypothetical protein
LNDVPIDRPLNDLERELLASCAIQTLARATGHHPEAVRIVLAEHAGREEVEIRGDAVEVSLHILGRCIVTVKRDWLAFSANFGVDPEITDWQYEGPGDGS